jgi:hypothetical protein
MPLKRHWIFKKQGCYGVKRIRMAPVRVQLWYSTIKVYKAEKYTDQPRKYCLIHAEIFLFNPLLCFLHFPAVHSRLLHTFCRRSGFIFLTVCTSRWLYTLSVPLTVSEKVCKLDRKLQAKQGQFLRHTHQ